MFQRAPAVLPLLALLAACRALSAETPDEWLARASNPALTLRQREFAARQVLMLADSSASILIAGLNDPESGLKRQVAARLLGELASPGAEAALLEAAFSSEHFLAEAAADALARLYARLNDDELLALFRRGGRERGATPGAVPNGEDWLALTLRDARSRARFRSFVMRGLSLKYRSLQTSMPGALAECVWDGLADGDRELRLRSAAAAGNTGSPDAPEKIASFLYSETDPKLLAAGLRAMAAMRPPDYGDAVERHVSHDDPMVALEALAALDAMGYEHAMFSGRAGGPSVAAFVRHPSTPVRRRAVELLAGSKNPSALEPLVAALSDRVGANRALAARALGELGFSAAVGALSPLRHDGRPEVRAEAAVALHSLGVVGVTAWLLDDLENASLPFQRAAAGALGRIDDRRAAPHLAKTLADEDAELARIAAEALAALGDRSAGAALYAMMTDAADPATRDSARRALAAIFRDDPGDSPASRQSWLRRAMPAGAE